MSFDGLMLHHVTNDLKNALIGHRITKIYQLSTYDLLFQVRKQKQSAFLMSTSPRYTRLHRTENTYEKPDHPPMFCMFLRKHIEGSIIQDITQHGNDRIVTFTLKSTNELGDLTEKYLIFEALGKDANIIVADENKKILDAMKHTGPFDQTERTIVPSAIYTYPTDTRINPFNYDAIERAFTEARPKTRKEFLDTFSGISPQFIREYQHRLKAGQEPLDTFNSLVHETHYERVEADKAYYSFMHLSHLEGTRTHYESPQALFDAFFFERDQHDKRKQKAKDLTQFIRRQIERLKHKQENLAKDLDKSSTLEQQRLFGELILSYQHTIQKGDRHLTCENYYTHEDITIPLDPNKTPAQNSEKYFKTYKKLKKSIPYIKRQIKKAKEELDYFLLLEAQIEHANLQDLEEVRDELIEQKYLKTKPKKGKRKKTNQTTYLDALGIEILVGKNNVQNEQITHKLAEHFHVWFHVQNAPGSHVVVKQGFPLDETTIRTAAHLASYFSKMRHASSVPVDYTEVKHIKKIPGKRNCFVTYKAQKTIFIDPDSTFIQSLKIKK